MKPLLTLEICREITAARQRGAAQLSVSLDLGRSETPIVLGPASWSHHEHSFPYLEDCKERAIYYWEDGQFQILSRYQGGLFKLVPTRWGAPTFEIDGIKMLVSEAISPYLDAERKVKLIRPQGKVILDCCGGLGYFAAWCLEGNASQVISFEKNAAVLWLRSKNPWSPPAAARLLLSQADVSQAIDRVAPGSVDAVLHDPPRFSIAGELYSECFYRQLARVLKPKGLLFHYTGAPQGASRGRDLPSEVASRLESCGFRTERALDGLLARRR